MSISNQENLDSKGGLSVHHWIAGVIIILFSLYYFALQSQSYDVDSYRYYYYCVEPDLLKYYRYTPDVMPHSIFWCASPGKANLLEKEIAYLHSLTFILFLRNLNVVTGSTFVTAKILVLPKLLIFLLGMYSLLYYLTKRVYPSLLVSMLAIIPRFMPGDHWGIGPVFSSEPKCFVYAFAPLLLVLFLKYRTDLRAMCLLYFGIGCLGNIHPATAMIITLMLSFTQLLNQQGFKNKATYAIVPSACAVLAVFPYLMVHLYKVNYLLHYSMLPQDLSSATRVASRLAKNALTLLKSSSTQNQRFYSPETATVLIRPFFNLNTLVFFLPVGICYFSKKIEDTSVKRILMAQFCYTLFFFFFPVLLYTSQGEPLGGWIGYIGRTSTLAYLFIFIFVTFAVVWLMDLTERWISAGSMLWKKRLIKVLVGCMVILVIYPPVGLKPNRYFPSYDFAGQFRAIRNFALKGFVTGGVDRHFTDMANYVKKAGNLPPEATITARNYDILIILAQRPTYPFPQQACKIEDQLSFYDTMFGRPEKKGLWDFFKPLLYPDFSYDSQCEMFVKDVSRYLKNQEIDYVIVNSRYSDYLNDNLRPVYSNEKYILCINVHSNGKGCTSKQR